MKPFRLETVLEKLPTGGVWEVLLSEVRGYGRQKGHLDKYREHEYELTFLPKVRVEIYCEDEAVGALEEAIVHAARTGRIGDGKILVCDVELGETL
ncbi:MAG: P-II family nitrogen regulator [Planctomycetota bacterium]|nr:P-II family nitrogen regulator [Planctomycetota bacterium]